MSDKLFYASNFLAASSILQRLNNIIYYYDLEKMNSKKGEEIEEGSEKWNEGKWRAIWEYQKQADNINNPKN